MATKTTLTVMTSLWVNKRVNKPLILWWTVNVKMSTKKSLSKYHEKNEKFFIKKLKNQFQLKEFSIMNSSSSSSAEYKMIDQINDAVYTYCVPVICLAGVVTNLLNAIVLSNRSLKNVIFQYYRMNAFSNIIYLTICFFVFTVRCGRLCDLNRYYSVQLYFWIFYGYVKGNESIDKLKIFPLYFQNSSAYQKCNKNS